MLCFALLCFTLSSASLPRPGGMRDASQSGGGPKAGAVSDHGPKGKALFPQIGLLRSKDGFAHSARWATPKCVMASFWPQDALKMAQVASKLPLTCHLASDVAGKLPQDASEEGFRPSRCHLGPILAPSWGAKWAFCIGGVAFFSMSPFLS